MDGILWESDETSQPGTPRTPTLGSSSRSLKGIIPRGTSGDTRSTHTMEHGVLPLSGRKYAASLSSLLLMREPSDEARSLDVAPETGTSSLGRRARFKGFVKGLFKF